MCRVGSSTCFVEHVADRCSLDQEERAPPTLSVDTVEEKDHNLHICMNKTQSSRRSTEYPSSALSYLSEADTRGKVGQKAS